MKTKSLPFSSLQRLIRERETLKERNEELELSNHLPSGKTCLLRSSADSRVQRSA